MKKYPYWYYIVGVFVVWIGLLIIMHSELQPARFHNLVIFAAGFLIGVIAASIARIVYK